MKRILALFLAVTAAMLITAAITGCGGENFTLGGSGEFRDESTSIADVTAAPEPLPPPPEFLGVWESVAGNDSWANTLVFAEDGSFTDNDGDSGRYRVEGNTVAFEREWFTESFAFVIDGDSLTIDGTVILRRVGAPPNPGEGAALLAGTWTADGNQWYHRIVFTTSGRFTDNDGDSGNFVVGDDEITFDWDAFELQTIRYTLSDDTLTLAGRTTLRRRV
jgi:hypothetical protein